MISKYLATALLSTALMTGSVLAETTTAPEKTSNAAITHKDGEWRSSKLVGIDVHNAANDKVGEIEELIVDKSGKIEKAILGVGGFLGMGEKLFAVPWGVLKLDSVNQRFILDVDKDHLKSAPGFDKDHWPDMADQSWASEIDTYYGSNRYGDSTPRL